MRTLATLLAVGLLSISGCGALGITTRAAARAACSQLTDSEFEDVVELARLARDSGGSEEDWNGGLGTLCIALPVDFSTCSECVRAVGDYVWGG